MGSAWSNEKTESHPDCYRVWDLVHPPKKDITVSITDRASHDALLSWPPLGSTIGYRRGNVTNTYDEIYQTQTPLGTLMKLKGLNVACIVRLRSDDVPLIRKVYGLEPNRFHVKRTRFLGIETQVSTFFERAEKRAAKPAEKRGPVVQQEPTVWTPPNPTAPYPGEDSHPEA
jgi:hypothetical protein